MTPRHDSPLDPVSGLRTLIDGYWRSQVVCAAARLGLADLLAGGPLTLPELAAECGVPEDALSRLMRALVGLDVCAVGPEGFRTTALGRALESTAPGGAYERALITADHHYSSWGDLTDCLCVGSSSAALRPERVPGPPPVAGSEPDPDEASRIAQACPVPEGARLVDVGGNAATLVTALRAQPADVVDRVPVGAGVPVGRDAPGTVSGGRDVYLMSRVLHACDDERATTLLGDVRRGMHPDARLLVVEQLLTDDPGAGTAHASLQDLHMLVTTGGCERTEAEYVTLLRAAGLRHVRTAVPGRLGVVEARPA